MSKRAVVILGANGFSGRRTAEFLREYNTPFTAAGRNASRIKELGDRVPGIETAAGFEIVDTLLGTTEDLGRAFAKLVGNTAGPFVYNGPKVIEAVLKAGCRYIVGEQAWIREMGEKWGEKTSLLQACAAQDLVHPAPAEI